MSEPSADALPRPEAVADPAVLGSLPHPEGGDKGPDSEIGTDWQRVPPGRSSLWAAAVESTNAAVVVTSLDGRVLSWNRGAQRLYGSSAEAMIGQPIASLVAPDRLDELRRVDERLRQGEHLGPMDTVGLRADGRRVELAKTFSPVRDGAGRIVAVVTIAHEITERKRAEEDLQRTCRELEQGVTDRTAELAVTSRLLEQSALRLEELAMLKADFTAMVAHELGSSISTINGLATMVTTGELRPEEQTHALDAIRAETKVLHALVADLESAAVAERDDFAVRLRPVSVMELVAEAAAFNRTLPGFHPLTTLIAVSGRVLADPQRVGQVLRNLIGNAAKYSPIGAPIVLSATHRGSRIRIEVADQGRGITPDDLWRVFEKFGRGRDEHEQSVPGVGLGLYLSRRIVQAHGARLTVESTPGVGSVFGFELEAVP